MLEDLDIKNFALIDSSHVEFDRGFTVLSGETGAGKSILIGSLVFLLGGKTGVELIRTGCHEAQVCGTFVIENKDCLLWLEEHGIEVEENRVLIRRVIKETGKSSAWIEGTPVTRADLVSFASFLIDIHGQHEQQSLMKISEHRRYLDIYAGIVDQVADFTALYANLVEKRRRLESLNTNESDRLKKIDLLNFAISEIQEAKLKAGEDEELETEESKLSSFERLYSDIEEINGLFEGEDGSSSGLLSVFRRLNNLIPHAVSLDKELDSLDSRLRSCFYEIDDIAKEFRRYENELVFDPDRLTQVQERLELLYKLKKKYASSVKAPIAEVITYLEKAQKELDELTGEGQDMSSLEQEIQELEKLVYTRARELSLKRKEASDKMSQDVEQILFKLGMQNTRFKVSLSAKEELESEQKCGPYGIDNIEFLISANPGSPLQPLSKIASGGEISRVMLALKTVLASGDTVGTLVFDEIDTGIGGEVAVAVGSHMKKLASKKQILCITHLASIAVYADNQIKIQKGVEGNSTATVVHTVTGEERIEEVARMLSGDPTSAESREHAAVMLQKFGGM